MQLSAGNHVIVSCFLRQQRSVSMTTTVQASLLSNDKQTAERTSESCDGIVMSRDHMVENTVYEVNNQSVTKIHFVVAMGVQSGLLSTAILRRVFESRPY